MKKNYLLALLIVSSISGIAQIAQSNLKSYSQKNSNYVSQLHKAAGAPNAIASVDTVWSDDFSDTLNWVYTGGVDEWNIDTILPVDLVNQGFDEVIFSNSGGNFAYIDSDGSGSTGSQDATIEYSGTIDCSTYPAVQLVFQTYLRQYQETRQVLVSNDGGVIWDTIDVLTQFGNSTTSPNPYTEVVDISSAAGGQANVSIKFRYFGSFDWFWVIDDVNILTVPNNEIELTQEYYNGTGDLTYTNYYTMIPIKQADSSIINFGAEVVNNGVADQSNTFVTVDVKLAGNTVFSDTTDSVLLTSGSSHSFDFTNAFQPDSVLGVYNIKLEAISDSVDALPRNNVIESSFEVSSYQYRRDNDTLTSDNWFNVSNSWEMLVKYEIYQQDSVVALSVFFPFNTITGRGLVEGDSISYYVYASTDLNNPITSNENYMITLDDVNSWVTLPIPVTELAKGDYYVGFKINGNSGSVGTNAKINSKTAPLTVLVRTDATSNNDPWQYTTAFTPFVRMFTKTESSCTGVSIDIDLTVVDTVEFGSVLTQVSGTGAAPFNYNWEGPNGFVATSKNLSDLEDQGMYFITVTDIFGCQGNDTAIVAGSVNVEELGNSLQLKLFPNPVTNHVQITGTVPHSGMYFITLYNEVGKFMMRKSVFVDKDLSQSVDVSDLAKGVYIVHVSGGETMKSGFVIIKE